MGNNPVVWFEIYVQDTERARKFYEAVLNVKMGKLDTAGIESSAHPGMEMWAFPRNMNGPGATGALVRMSGVPSGGNSVLVYFSCGDCAVEAGRVVKAGGRVQREKIAIGQHGFIALAFDTEGNMFGLHSMK
jgi:predicted enzyme related to lactoylglutathione lyase